MTVEYTYLFLEKMENLKEYLYHSFDEEIGNTVLNDIIDYLDNITVFSCPGISIRERLGYDLDERFCVFRQNIFLIRICNDRLIILDMFNEREDFYRKIRKMLNLQ